MQLDAEEGEGWAPPAGIVASPTSDAKSPFSERPDSQGSEATDARAAAEATREIEE